MGQGDGGAQRRLTVQFSSRLIRVAFRRGPSIVTDDVPHIYSNARRHLLSSLTILIAVSPIVPVLAWSVSASEARRETDCVDTVVFSEARGAVVSRACPGRLLAIEEPRPATATSIDIRNLTP